MSETTILTGPVPVDAALPGDAPAPSTVEATASPAGALEGEIEVAPAVADRPVATRSVSPLRWAGIPVLLVGLSMAAWIFLSPATEPAVLPPVSVPPDPVAVAPMPEPVRVEPEPEPEPEPVRVEPTIPAAAVPTPATAAAPKAPQVAPTPKAAPKAKAKSTPAPVAAPPEPARISVDARGGLPIELRGKRGTRGAGDVPAGTWEVWADFGDGLVRALSVTAEAGETYEVFCNRTLQTCGLR